MCPKDALPEHLRDRLHDDWLIWPLNKTPRAWTSYKFTQPPTLLIGYNIMSFVMQKDIMPFDDYPYGKGWIFGNPSSTHGASIIQKLKGKWKFSFQIVWPLGISFTIKLWKFKDPTQHECDRGYDGVRIIYFSAITRWDSFDSYYSFPSFFIGLTYN